MEKHDEHEVSMEEVEIRQLGPSSFPFGTNGPIVRAASSFFR